MASCLTVTRKSLRGFFASCFGRRQTQVQATQVRKVREREFSDMAAHVKRPIGKKFVIACDGKSTY